MTKVQKAILETVVQHPGHLSADQVYWMVKKQFPSIALGTIYRNLNRFADDRRIRRVARAGGADLFEGNVLPHDHALCLCCGCTSDLAIPDLKDFLTSRIGGEIVAFDLTVSYVCPHCREEKKKRPGEEQHGTEG